MKNINSLSRQLLGAYYRQQSSEVKENFRKAVGIRDSSFEELQISDNQSVMNQRKENNPNPLSHELSNI